MRDGSDGDHDAARMQDGLTARLLEFVTAPDVNYAHRV